MDELTRRAFLKLAGGGALLPVAFGGTKQVDKLIPYVIPPEDTLPGEITLFATTCRECPAGCGMHLHHVDGRVIKAEGNPEHPINRGRLCPRGQSSLQGLYDPDRSKELLRRDGKGRAQRREWPDALEQIGRRLRQAPGRLLFVSDLQTGALAEVMQAFASRLGAGKVLFWEPFDYAPLREAHRSLYGVAAIPDYRIDQCELVVSFAADFLGTWVSPVGLAARFADQHGYQPGRELGRLVYIGPHVSLTAASTDDLFLLAPSSIPRLAFAMLRVLVDRGWARRDAGAIGGLLRALPAELAEWPPEMPVERVAALARSFVEAKGSVALAGPVGGNGPIAEQIAMATALLNHAAGRVGQTVDFSRVHALGQLTSRGELLQQLRALTPRDTVIVHQANLAYADPALRGALEQAGELVYLGTTADETAGLASWALPVDSPLESWGDYEPAAGIHSSMQPTMARVHHTRLAGNVLLALAEAAGTPLARPGAAQPAQSFEQWLEQRWAEIGRRVAPAASADSFRREALARGVVIEPPATVSITLRPEEQLRADLQRMHAPRAAAESGDGALELWAWPSALFFDGRVANRGWLQESGDPLTTVAWGSWVDLHPEQARRLVVEYGDIVELGTTRATVRAPVRVSTDVVGGVVAIPFGQGHTALGRNAAGRGANAFALLAPDGRSLFARVRLRKVGHRAPTTISATEFQYHRELLQWVDLSALREMKAGEGKPLDLPLEDGYKRGEDLYKGRKYKKHRWAMVIDLQRCIGCHACTVACYAENNIVVYGEEPTRKGRQMAWIRVPPYRDDRDQRRLGFLPLPCQQCDAAPCEPVCPVYASVHNEEGLNAQVYNRCVGTRYCSNNCPYKVRRFGWFNPQWEPPLEWQLNPDVTVRSRGVMEKCTFCIQRIRRAEHRAALENRPVRDGEVQPACVQTCPTRAFTFGDLLDPRSQVRALALEDPRRYQVLEELNTKPAVIYLRRIRRS